MYIRKYNAAHVCKSLLYVCVCLQTERTTVMDVIEKATPNIIKHYLSTITQKERVSPASTITTFLSSESLRIMYNRFRPSSDSLIKASHWHGWLIARLVFWSKGVVETVCVMPGHSVWQDSWNHTYFLKCVPRPCTLPGPICFRGWVKPMLC